MAKFAPVAGWPVLWRLSEDRDAIGDYHLWLAHDVLKNPSMWAASLRYEIRSRHDGAEPTIIMDNSLIELGYPLEVGDVHEAAAAVNASYVVLPDILGDASETLERSVKAAAAYRDIWDKGDWNTPPYKLMGVVQGQGFMEALLCAQGLIEQAQVSVLAVPRIMVRNLGTRVGITHTLWEKFQVPIHLLGFSDNVMDDLATAGTCDGVMGIDSTWPIRMGMAGADITAVKVDLGKRPESYLTWGEENDAKMLPKLVFDNLKKLRRWLA